MFQGFGPTEQTAMAQSVNPAASPSAEGAQAILRQQALRAALGQETSGTPLQFYPGQTYAGFSPQELQAQRMALAAAQGQQTLAQGGQQALLSALDATNVYNNPALQAAVQGAIAPVQQQLMEQTLPAVRGGAIQAGGYGGSRQQLMERGTIDASTKAMMDRAAGMYSDAYAQGLQARTQAMGLQPQMQQAQLSPAATYGMVGEQNRAMQQQGINEQIARWDFRQNEPWQRWGNYASLMGGGGGQQPLSSGGAPTSGGLSGAARGAALGTSIMPGWGTAIGAIGGGLGLF
jgi:hypothetical protein